MLDLNFFENIIDKKVKLHAYLFSIFSISKKKFKKISKIYVFIFNKNKIKKLYKMTCTL